MAKVIDEKVKRQLEKKTTFFLKYFPVRITWARTLWKHANWSGRLRMRKTEHVRKWHE